MNALLATARFGPTVARLDQLPAPDVPEIAFVGRSNAGKSSAINAICQRRRLAFASRTPGRTQALNFFALGREDEPAAGYLVDTPGYGYAAAPLAVRGNWDHLAGRYLGGRSVLRAVVLVLDCRREVTDLDRHLLSFLGPATPVLILMAKSDKLGFAERQKDRRRIGLTLDSMKQPNPLTLIPFSANTGLGLAEARDWIVQWVNAG